MALKVVVYVHTGAHQHWQHRPVLGAYTNVGVAKAKQVQSQRGFVQSKHYVQIGQLWYRSNVLPETHPVILEAINQVAAKKAQRKMKSVPTPEEIEETSHHLTPGVDARTAFVSGATWGSLSAARRINALEDTLVMLRNHTSVSLNQIEMIDDVLAGHRETTTPVEKET